MSNQNQHISGGRRPTTRKEIKFFGTALSLDEEMTIRSTIKCNASPKFMRTQSFGMLSPKSGRKLLRGRDKNSNFDFGTAAVTVEKNSVESLCQRGSAISQTTNIRNASRQSMKRLKFVNETNEMNGGDGNECGADVDADSACRSMPRSEKIHRLIRLRTARMRSRSASTDSWDDPSDKR